MITNLYSLTLSAYLKISIFIGFHPTKSPCSRAYDKAAMDCNGQEAVTNFDPSTYEGDPSLVANDGGID